MWAMLLHSRRLGSIAMTGLATVALRCAHDLPLIARVRVNHASIPLGIPCRTAPTRRWSAWSHHAKLCGHFSTAR